MNARQKPDQGKDISIKNISILLVEDDDSLREAILGFLKKKCEKIYWATNGSEGFRHFVTYSPDVVITDIKMPGMDGLEMSQKIKEKAPETPIIIITAFTEVSYLIKAIEIGVDRFVQKPIDRKNFMAAILHCALPIVQQKEIDGFQQRIEHSLVEALGTSAAVKPLINLIQQLASSNFSLVLYGDTGVGKSFLARIIHNLSTRSDKPFVTVDIGAIPETLVESELFGHKKGAFTGAASDRKGFFRMAEGGTIFLDELENLSSYMQSKLLLAVDEKKIIPLGSSTPIEVDVRIIAAANKDLQQEVNRGKFREDLFYRLNDFSVRIPPLKERSEDIPFLAAKFMTEAAEELDKTITNISLPALEVLQTYSWPGNIRELKSVMRRAVLFCREKVITVDNVSLAMNPGEETVPTPAAGIPVSLPVLTMDELEKWGIREALRLTNGKKMEAASLLKIGYSTLKRKISKYGINA
ncbi:MAG: sigma-54-dependent Fis family transcriptional regulator [Candidatus Aminicenantes bacterium]|nr:MAG: sigma-54-dependent Fis family transcriptional regulator [Candidatus Aminicenantes bacterium]